MYKLLIIFLLLSFSGFSTNVDSLKLATKSGDTLAIDAMNSLASHYRRRNPDSAKYFLTLAIIQSNKLSYKPGNSRAHIELGIQEKNAGNYRTSLSYYGEGESIAREINDSSLIALALNGKGIAHKKLGKFLEASRYYHSAAQIWEAQGKKYQVATAYNNLGNLARQTKDYELALDYHMKGLALRKEIKDTLSVSYSYHNLGIIYENLKQHDSAIYYLNKSIEIKRDKGQADDLASSILTLGGVYKSMGQYELAKGFLDEAYELYHNESQDGLTIVYQHYAEFYFDQGDFARAEDFAKKALELGQKMDSWSLEETAHSQLKDIYEKLGDYKRAYHHSQLAEAIEDSMFNENQLALIRDLETQYEVAKKEKEIAESKQKIGSLSSDNENLNKSKTKLTRDKEQQQKLLFWLSLFSVVLILAIVWALISNKKRSLALKELAAQKKLAEDRTHEAEKANRKIVLQNKEIAAQHKDIQDSIKYAERIQAAVLTDRSTLDNTFKETLLIYKPKDVISGDFYWFRNFSEHSILVVSDCTGHGVPGSMMSMMGINLLNQIVARRNVTSPSMALKAIDQSVISALQLDKGNQSHDGMDIILCAFHHASKTLEYSSANQHLLHISKNGKFELHKPQKISIGGHNLGEKKFVDKKLQLESGDQIYLFSDGFQDQFGGEQGKKLKRKGLLEQIEKVSQKPMAEQEKYLEQFLANWMGDLEQIDDICLLGFKID